MSRKPIQVSILVFPECDPSIIYGMYDTLWFAGIEWVNGKTSGEHLFESRIVTAEPGAIRLCTGVSIVSQATVDEVDQHRRCVHAQRHRQFRRRSAEARSTAARLARAHARAGSSDLCGVRRLAGSGGGWPAGRPGGDDPLVLCAVVPAGVSKREAARGSHPGADRPRPHHPVLRRRIVVAGSGAAADRQIWRHRRGDPHLEVLPLPVAPRWAAAVHVDDRQQRAWRRGDRALPDLAGAELRASRHHRRAGAALRPAQAHVRPALPRPRPAIRRWLTCRRCASRRPSICWRPAPSRSRRSRRRSAMPTWRRSAGCSAGRPACRPGIIAGSCSCRTFVRQLATRLRDPEATAARSGTASPADRSRPAAARPARSAGG